MITVVQMRRFIAHPAATDSATSPAPRIRVDLSNGRVVVVTVDDPETGVALFNAEVAYLPPPDHLAR